jgi:hypothetical protein
MEPRVKYRTSIVRALGGPLLRTRVATDGLINCAYGQCRDQKARPLSNSQSHPWQREYAGAARRKGSWFAQSVSAAEGLRTTRLYMILNGAPGKVPDKHRPVWLWSKVTYQLRVWTVPRSESAPFEQFAVPSVATRVRRSLLHNHTVEVISHEKGSGDISSSIKLSETTNKSKVFT